MRRPRLHPACTLFSPLPEDELRTLAEDIAANGLQNPIVQLGGMILDGRNRFEACKLAGVEPDFVEWDGDDPVRWVISQNLVRRHLTASQRAVIALDLLPLLENEAKERQRLSNGRGQKGRKNSRTFSDSDFGAAADVAARLTKSNTKYVRAVKQIGEAAPELVEEIRSGRITVHDAEKLADLPESRRRQLLAESSGDGDIFRRWKETPQRKKPRPNRRSTSDRKLRLDATMHLCGDCRTELRRLAGASVDLVLCDPPYPEVRPYLFTGS